jgi:hypothetical protein
MQINLLGRHEAQRGGLNLPKGEEFMYRWSCLAWLRGAFARIRAGAMRNMESEKFTEIFEEELDLPSIFLDPGGVGNSLAESFVISIKTNLSMAEPAEQKLSHVGTLCWNGETVIWLVNEEAKVGRRLLSEFLRKNAPDDYLIDRVKAFFEEDRPGSDPFPGVPLLSGLGQLFSSASGLRDSKKTTVAWEFACLVVHDAIACGAGIELQSVGHFRSDFKFDPDPVLIDTITALRKVRTNRQTGEKVFRARRLNVGS